MKYISDHYKIRTACGVGEKMTNRVRWIYRNGIVFSQGRNPKLTGRSIIIEMVKLIIQINDDKTAIPGSDPDISLFIFHNSSVGRC